MVYTSHIIESIDAGNKESTKSSANWSDQFSSQEWKDYICKSKCLIGYSKESTKYTCHPKKYRITRSSFNLKGYLELLKASISTTYLPLKTTKVDISQLFHCFNISSHTFIINSLKFLPSRF